MDKTPPLFVPLRAEYFRAFAEGSKTVEWRKFGPRFNDKTLYRGRSITLSNGYSGARLYGRITALELKPAEAVPHVGTIYKPKDLLVGIHVKLISLKPQPPQRS
jgi:hypothetical protein